MSRATLEVGTRILCPNGLALVTAITPHNYCVRDAAGTESTMPWEEFVSARRADGGRFTAKHTDLLPWWDSLPKRVREETLLRLEVVHLIETGFRDGYPELARPNEPESPYDPADSESLNTKARHAAETLSTAGSLDARKQTRKAFGDVQTTSVSVATVKRWVHSWRAEGIRGLVDGRSDRATSDFERVAEEYREEAEREIAKLQGDTSPVSQREVDRRIRVALKKRGVAVCTPQRATDRFLSERMKANGKTARSQRSRRLREVSGDKSYPVIRPGQVVAIDATRCDDLVYDEYDGTPRSVDILTALDVLSRDVLALRVCPVNANNTDLGMLLYDILRPFHMLVDGTTVDDWRWAGLPEAIDLTDATAVFPGLGRGKRTVTGRPLDGVHKIPSVMPDGVRVDRGSINVSKQTQFILQQLGIDLLPNRGGKSNDNAHIERWWETLQAAVQQIPGYKGRNPSQRGRLAAEEPLLTANELETTLRRWVALVYHRNPHSGLTMPGATDVKLSPLEMFDSALEVCGRIDVPQRHDLLYQFLPVVWLTPTATGVEHKNLVYGSELIREYFPTHTGQFRNKDRAMPFFVDANDLAQLWFQHPETGEVTEVAWRGRDLTSAPMAEKVVDAAAARVRQRGGRNALNRDTASNEILEQLGQLMDARSTRRVAARQLYAAQLRVDASRFDHAQAAATRESFGANEPPRPSIACPTAGSTSPLLQDADDDVWPDYTLLDQL